MPYIGNNLATQFQAFATQTITGDGSTSYTLDRAVANGKELLVYINNVKQEEGSGKSYEASGTTITFSEAVASTDSCYLVYMGSAQQTVTAPAGSIVSGQIANANLEMPNTLDMNGKELILDADGDTTIHADTDDQIDIKVAGSDKLRIDSSGNLLVGTTDNNPNNNSANSTADNGISIQPSGLISIATHQNSVMVLNRTGSDGQLVDIRRSGTSSGFIGTSETIITILGSEGDAGLAFQNNTYGDIIYPASNASSGTKDDAIDLGYSSGRFDDIYATNGTIQTSDQNEKQDIASATEKELNVAKKLSALFKTFKWKSKVAEKGDKARTHSGIVAQEVKAAFSAEGLDAYNYGLFTETSWWEEEDDSTVHYKTEQEYKDKGSPSSAVKKTRLGVRYPELFSFIFSSIEARLTALESK